MIPRTNPSKKITIDKLNHRIDIAEEGFKNGRYKTTKELLKKILIAKMSTRS